MAKLKINTLNESRLTCFQCIHKQYFLSLKKNCIDKFKRRGNNERSTINEVSFTTYYKHLDHKIVYLYQKYVIVYYFYKVDITNIHLCCCNPTTIYDKECNFIIACNVNVFNEKKVLIVAYIAHQRPNVVFESPEFFFLTETLSRS